MTIGSWVFAGSAGGGLLLGRWAGDVCGGETLLSNCGKWSSWSKGLFPVPMGGGTRGSSLGGSGGKGRSSLGGRGGRLRSSLGGSFGNGLMVFSFSLGGSLGGRLGVEFLSGLTGASCSLGGRGGNGWECFGGSGGRLPLPLGVDLARDLSGLRGGKAGSSFRSTESDCVACSLPLTNPGLWLSTSL